MPTFNDLDVGSGHPFLAPDSGLTIASVVVEGSYTTTVGRASKVTTHNVLLWVKAWQGVGGQPALSIRGSRYVVRQLLELARNRDLSPVYIRWTTSSDPAALLNSADLADGWYWITSCKPDFSKVPSGLIPIRMTVSEVRQGGAEVPVALRYSPLTPGISTNYSGAAQLLIGLPVNSGGLGVGAVTRSGAEGSLPAIVSPTYDPVPFQLSATPGDWFKGSVRVYDTINTAANPVPTTGGTFLNANWVQVYDRSHKFEGDVFLTNGLLGLLIQTGQSRLAQAYLWNTATATTNWQNTAALQYWDNSSVAGTLNGLSLERVGLESCAVRVLLTTSNRNQASILVRLDRGMYHCRLDFTPLSQATTNTATNLVIVSTGGGLIYDSANVYDFRLAAEQFPAANAAADYGYAAAFQPSNANPFIHGWLFQNKPNSQLYPGAGNLYFQDGNITAVGGVRTYGYFAIPFGVSGTYSPLTLQAECEGGVLGAGWSSVADANASGGNAAQLASGTLTGNSDAFGSTWTPPGGNYILAVRYRNSGAPTQANEIQVGALLGGAFTSEFTLGSGSGSKPGYVWALSAAFALSGSQTFRFQIQSAATTSVTWDFDEAVLLPVGLGAGNLGPQQIWAQFMADCSRQLVGI